MGTTREHPPQVTQNITIGQGAQSITFGTNPGPVTYLPSGTFTVSATASSGLSATFSSTITSVCTAGAATVTIVTAGTCTIAANQTGNANFSPASQLSQPITINRTNQAALTAGSTATSLNVGQTATLSSTSGSGSGSGAESYSSDNANCSINGTTLTVSAARRCTITASKAADINYNSASSAGLAILDERIFSNGFE